MKKSLVAKHHLSIQGYGSVTPGEVLDDELLYILDDAQIDRLLKRGALAVMGGEEEDAPEADAPTQPAQDAPLDQDAAVDDAETAAGPGDAEPASAQSSEEAATAEAEAAETVDAPLEMDATEAIVDAPAPAPKQKAATGKKGAAK